MKNKANSNPIFNSEPGRKTICGIYEKQSQSDVCLLRVLCEPGGSSEKTGLS
jgi:hypothetical protein